MIANSHNYRLGLMASGSGTIIEAIGNAIMAFDLPMEITTVVYDRPEAGVVDMVAGLNRMYGWDIEPVLVDKRRYSGGPGERSWDLTDQQSSVMAGIFEQQGVALIAMCGFLSRVRGDLFKTHGWVPGQPIETASLVNTHPGLLSVTKRLWGPSVHKAALASGLDHSAQTLHVVSEEYDEGAEIIVNTVPIMPGDDWQALERRVQAREKACIARDIFEFIERRDEFFDEESDEY